MCCTKQRKVGLLKTLYHRAQTISSPKLLLNEIKVIKELPLKNGYSNNLIERVLNSEAKRSNNNVPNVDKFLVLLVLPYIWVKYNLFEKNIKEITENTYLAAKPRIIFKSNSLFTLGGKDQIFKKSQ